MMNSALGDCCMPSKKKSRSAPTTATTSSGQTGQRETTGAREDDVDALVEAILKDPSINISIIPDSVERLIYKSTIQLTLNAFYSIIKGLEGTRFMAHQIHLQIIRGYDDDDDDFGDKRARALMFFEQPTSDIDDVVLEQVANRLLANKAINQRFLPDQIEHLLYTNCLKVVFRMLDILTTSLRVTVCGHDVGLFLEPTTWQDLVQQHSMGSTTNKSNKSPSLSEIDQDKLREFARQEAGITEELDSFWDSLFVPRDFVAQMHASLYALILGIVDDMLASTKIEILSDHIKLDIVPVNPEDDGKHQTQERGKVPSTIHGTGTEGESQTEQLSLTQFSNNDADPVQETTEQQDNRKEVCQKLKSLGFETEREVLLHRFHEMTPEQRAILAEDLKSA